VPQDFSKYQELQASFDYLADQYQASVPKLRDFGFIGTVSRMPERISIRVEQAGQTAYSLDIGKGGGHGDDKLTFAVNQRGYSNAINGYATPFFDKEAQLPKLRVLNFSILPHSVQETDFAKEELFEILWGAMVDRLQNR